MDKNFGYFSVFAAALVVLIIASMVSSSCARQDDLRKNCLASGGTLIEATPNWHCINISTMKRG